MARTRFAMPLSIFILVVPAAIAQSEAPGVPVAAVADSPDAIDVMDLAPDFYDRAATMQTLTLSGLPIDDPAAESLVLERFEVFAADAELIVATPAGPQALPRPSVALFRTADTDSPVRAFLSISPFGVYGLIQTPTDEYVLSTGPAESGLPLAVTSIGELAATESITAPTCAAEGADFIAPGFVQRPAGSIAGAPPCRRARIAVETDNEYLNNLFGGNTTAANAYVATLFGAVSQIYFRDVQTSLEISFIRLWTNPDPWTQGNTGDQLPEFRQYWNTNQGGTTRHVAHFLSGRNLGGGIAYLGGLCNGTFGYGLSANLAGFFPLPIVNNNANNWDLMVAAHELGHNFGAPHTHGMEPPVDCCGGTYVGNECGNTQNCNGANQGTIMSYCHICPGGMANLRMEFHPRSISETMLPFLDDADSGSCSLSVPPATITGQPQPVQAAAGASVIFNVTASGPAPISYQWRRNNSNINNGGRVSGATTPTLTINSVNAGDNGSYDVVLMSICGVIDSANANLTVGATGCNGNRGDANCNGIRDFFDLDPFLLALFNPGTYATTHCAGSFCTVDTNCDDVINFFDIDSFLDCVFSGCANCP